MKLKSNFFPVLVLYVAKEALFHRQDGSNSFKSDLQCHKKSLACGKF